MSIIQQIREKYAAVGFGAIALSLIAFILMDAGKSGGGGDVSVNDALGEVNGVNISYGQFMDRAKQTEQMYEQNNRVVDENTRQQIYAESWRSMVEDELIHQEQNKLGLTVTDKEFNDLLYGKNPPEDLKRAFTDPKTGQYDVAMAKQQFAQMKKTKGEQRDQVETFFAAVIDNRLKQKYYGLLQNSAYIPKWMTEKTMADNNAIASFNYVTVPYSTISDSSVVISDDQINAYVQAHKSEFKQEENSRSIAYVSFSFLPSAADSAAALSSVLSLKDEFTTTTDPGTFVTRNSSSLAYFDGYNSKAKIQIPQKDSIIGSGKGHVYGPYYDGNSIVVSRVVDEKVLPDSVRVKHILIGTIDPATQQPKLDDATAKKKADSIFAAIKAGGNFEMMALQFSDDGSKMQGGDMGYFAAGTMVKEFNDYAFEKKVGDMDVVRTQFGYHIMQVTGQKDFAPAYKIAYMAKAIEPSQETINDAQSKANIFYGNSRSLKAFDENVSKSGYNKLIANDIKQSDYQVTGLGVNRKVVREIFEKDKGTILEPEEFDNQFVVIAITGEEKAGVQSAAKARPTVETILRNQEKAKRLSAKIGKPASLDAVAKSQLVSVQRADSVSFASPVLPGAGFEPKVGGYAVNKATLNKVSSVIPGNSGVYVIQADMIGARMDASSTIEELQRTLVSQQKSSAMYSSAQALRAAAKIKDKRSKFPI
ncbi:MAG: peptidylprolyl isomerase [Bacteroidota bacterium]